MGKRKSSSDHEDYDYIMKKIKKLEKKLKRSKRKRHDSLSSNDYSDIDSSPKNNEDGVIESMYYDDDCVPIELTNPVENSVDPANCIDEPTPGTSTSDAAAVSTPITNEAQPSTSGAEQAQPQPQIDHTLLELLGADPSVTKKYSNEINPDLAIRLQHVVTSGLPADASKELQNKYLPPSNCTLIGAPMLNPEIKAAVTEAVLKRDKGIELKQKQLGSAIAGVSEAISVLLKDTDKNTEVIRLLMDAIRLICNCQHNDSITRRNFILFNLKKDMKDQLQKSKIDESLFGSDLAEILKTAKFISKSGAELKSAPPPKPSTSTFRKQTQPTMPQRNLNWKAPPPSRRPRGTQETKEPAQRSQATSSSRPSYRAPPPRKNRNRH